MILGEIRLKKSVQDCLKNIDKILKSGEAYFLLQTAYKYAALKRFNNPCDDYLI